MTSSIVLEDHPNFQLSLSDFSLGDRIGGGAYGNVFKGEYEGREVNPSLYSNIAAYCLDQGCHKKADCCGT